MQHVYGHGGNLVMNVLTMPLHWAHFGLHPTTTSSLVGIIIPLMLLRVFMVVTTFMRFWNGYNAFGWRLCLFPMFEASIICFHRVLRVCYAFHAHYIVLCFVALSFFPFGCFCFEQAMDRHSSSASTVPSLDGDFEHNIWNLLLNLLFLEQVSCIFASKLVDIDLARIELSCLFALDLLCYKGKVLDSAR